MALRTSTFLIATCACCALQAGSVNEPVEKAALHPGTELARPCLLSTERCDSLFPAQAAPCLLAVERCGQEHSFEKLVFTGPVTKLELRGSLANPMQPSGTVRTLELPGAK